MRWEQRLIPQQFNIDEFNRSLFLYSSGHPNSVHSHTGDEESYTLSLSLWCWIFLEDWRKTSAKQPFSQIILNQLEFTFFSHVRPRCFTWLQLLGCSAIHFVHRVSDSFGWASSQTGHMRETNMKTSVPNVKFNTYQWYKPSSVILQIKNLAKMMAQTQIISKKIGGKNPCKTQNPWGFSWIPRIPMTPNWFIPVSVGTWSNSPKSCPSCSNAPLPLLARQAQRSQMRALSMPRSGREPPKGKAKRYKIRLY